MNIVGSKWFKVDFHCHSPASDDFPRDSDLPKCSYREWLLGQMANEIDCVVLCDHNTAEGIDPIREELKQLQLEFVDNPENGYRPIVIMPGVELTTSDNTHIIAIFREDINTARIEQFIGQFDPPRSQKNHQLVLGSGSHSIIKGARQSSDDILIIPAHVDRIKGIFQNTNQIIVNNAFAEKPHAVELIGNIEDIGLTYQRALIENLAHVKGSDAHSIEEMGRSYTWVKMSEPSFDGLKVALLDPKHCIIRSPDDCPQPGSVQITKISIKSKLCKNDGNGPIEIDLSPWYTAIIGSRGSGKSTLVEAIRLGLRRDNNKYLPTDQLKLLRSFKDNAFEPDSEISIEYRKVEDLYKLTWNQSGEMLYHKNANGTWDIENTFSSSRFPVSIYSQKMLYEIATENGAFLSVIDSSDDVNYDKWLDQHTNLQLEYKRKCGEYRHSVYLLRGLSVTQGLFDDVKRKLDLLEKAGLKPLQEKLSYLHSVEQPLDKTIHAISELIESLELLSNDPIKFEVAEPVEVQSFISKAQLIHEAYITDVKQLIEKYKLQIQQLSTDEYFISIKTQIKEETTLLNQKVEELATVNITPDELSNLLQAEQDLLKKLTAKDQLGADIIQSELAKDTAYKNLIEHRKLLTKLRRDFIDSLDLKELKIKILPLGSNADVVTEDYQKYSAIERFTQNIYDSQNSNSLLYKLDSINKFASNSEELRYEEVEKLKKYHEDTASKVQTNDYNSLHGALKNRIENMSTEQIDHLRCWFPEDGLEIKFKDNEAQFRQLESASPGQKSASMLAFLMSYGTDPLILDQPEDDLDCGMLTSSVIPSISKNKSRRQIIIVSHSAPLVVNGDAELVVAMKQQSKKLQPFVVGGLQLTNVKEFICKQMEGGETAFTSRFNRIIG